MLSAIGSVQGSAARVALKRGTGARHGRGGAFAMQHTGTMHCGTPSLVVAMAPDWGTGALEGRSGTMSIDVGGKAHSHVFDDAEPCSPV